MIQKQYFKQAKLLIKLLPFLAREPDFALKGGTAINFYVRDFPRLSVDIDLIYLQINYRDIALKNISLMLERYSEYIKKIFPQSKITKKELRDSKRLIRLIITNENVSIKIETNSVIRGSVFPPQSLSLSSKAKSIFQQDVDAQILSNADLFAGKICAALDRQHPRDLFDIMKLFENEGITEDIRKAFIVYLLSHPRPIVELLNPNKIDISRIFETEFKGMTNEEISLQNLLDARDDLIHEINQTLSDDEKAFIVTFKKMEPEWSLLGLDKIQDLPAIKWKLYNLGKMSRNKHKIALDKLSEHLEKGFKG